MLRFLDWNKIFHVHVDASQCAIGCVLVQPGDNTMDRPIYFASQKLTKVEQNYTTTERKGLRMVYALQKFRYYLLANPFIFYIDHQALMYLVNKPLLRGRISCWLMLFQEFTFRIIIKLGEAHIILDQLSRMHNGEKAVGVSDDFPNATLFNVESVPVEWY